VQRVVLKISGEAFGSKEKPFEIEKIKFLTNEISKIKNVEFVFVVGGGNILRGKDIEGIIPHQATRDYLGMLSTVYNAVVLKEFLKKRQIKAQVYSQLGIERITDPYSPETCNKNLKKGIHAIIACGTGNPFVTTDTAAALRALELDAKILIKATKVDGVYSEDPLKNKKAVFYPELSYKEAIQKNLGFCDRVALEFLSGSDIKFFVFNIFKPNKIKMAISGKNPGTIIRKKRIEVSGQRTEDR